MNDGMTDPPASLTPAPEGYVDWLANLKGRIHAAQQRATLAVNRELVLLYWHIGCDILARQAEQGWGTKVIERLAHDLRTAFPEMKGFSRANLMYMRAFAQAWPNAEIVQQAVGRLPWGHNLVLLTRLKGQLGFYLTAVDRQIKSENDSPTIGLLLCKSKNKVVAEYALGDKTQPMGVAEFKLLESLPAELKTSLPSIEAIERELTGKSLTQDDDAP